MLPKKFATIGTFFFIFIVGAACAPLQPAPAAEAQLPQGAVETAVVATVQAMLNEEQLALTVHAALNEDLWARQTQAAATLQVLPTHTLHPTETITVTPTLESPPTPVEPTFTPFPPTPTRPAGFSRTPVKREYACAVFSQKPKDYVVMSPRQDFDMRWTILNTGTNAWTPRGTDYKYLRGPKMHKFADAYDLNVNIGPGGKLELVIDMVAPKEKGVHVAYWGLANGTRHFCQFYIIVIVQ